MVLTPVFQYLYFLAIRRTKFMTDVLYRHINMSNDLIFPSFIRINDLVFPSFIRIIELPDALHEQGNILLRCRCCVVLRRHGLIILQEE